MANAANMELESTKKSAEKDLLILNENFKQIQQNKLIIKKQADSARLAAEIEISKLIRALVERCGEIQNELLKIEEAKLNELILAERELVITQRRIKRV